jgi:hypothetical protein
MEPSPAARFPPCLVALQFLIQQASNHGFYISLRFLPQGVNDPYEWARTNSYDFARASHNWTFIQSVVDGLNGIYLDKYDLGNEEIPPSNTWFGAAPGPWNGAIVIQYASWLWSSFTAKYGTANTFGLSVACGDDCTQKLAQFPNVYGGNFPPVFNLHIYGQCAPGTSQTAQQIYLNAWNYLRGRGWGQTWVIGETCYDDYNTGRLLQPAHQQAGNTVWYLLQFPYPPSATMPLDYSQYISTGW